MPRISARFHSVSVDILVLLSEPKSIKSNSHRLEPPLLKRLETHKDRFLGIMCKAMGCCCSVISTGRQ